MRVSPRGRAILQRISGDEAAGRSYRPGDFVLTRSGGALARGMGLATTSGINHAALIVDSSGGLIEVNPFFVTSEGGLRRSHICDYLERGMPVWVGYVELVDGTRSEVVRFAEQMLQEQRRFTEWQFAGLLLHLGMGIAPRALTGKYRVLRFAHGLFDHHALVLKEENIFTSAEMVACALERGGFIWDRDPAYITPAALFERFCPPGYTQLLKRAALSRRHAPKPNAAVRAGGAHDAWQVGEAGAGEGPALQQDWVGEPGAESMPEALFAPREQHAQEYVAWRVGALIVGGALMALSLGWVARVLGIRTE
ncbi:MAG TPA: hypothetical protein VFU32_00325 [Ktedonobacterales bacterium]|nr:hypothetical protein [Ktedonobacterales bacterium]